MVSAIAETRAKISESELQLVKLDQDFRADVVKDLREAQDKEALDRKEAGRGEKKDEATQDKRGKLTAPKAAGNPSNLRDPARQADRDGANKSAALPLSALPSTCSGAM